MFKRNQEEQPPDMLNSNKTEAEEEEVPRSRFRNLVKWESAILSTMAHTSLAPIDSHDYSMNPTRCKQRAASFRVPEDAGVQHPGNVIKRQ